MSATRKARRFLVSGLVQGVGFRFFAQSAADRLGVTGYVRNLRGGQVDVYAIGTDDQLSQLKKELAEGPHSAYVHGVAEEDAELDPRFDASFSIEYDRW